MPFNLANLETSEGRTEPIPTLYSEFPLIIDNTAREQFFTSSPSASQSTSTRAALTPQDLRSSASPSTTSI